MSEGALMLWLLLACADTRVINGEVKDIWGRPVGDATIVIEGVVEQYHADASGVFNVEVSADLALSRAMAGKEGYIREVVDIAPPDEDGEVKKVTFALYPEPEQPGFYAVSQRAYVHLETQKVSVVGTELRQYAGIRDLPDEHLPRGTNRFVFNSTLRSSELSRMNLHLSRLEFIDHTLVKGVLGAADATVNLFVSAEEIPFDLKSLPSRDDYLITTREPLGKGVYAFHAQDVLNSEAQTLLNLPKEMQVVFAFEVN